MSSCSTFTNPSSTGADRTGVEILSCLGKSIVHALEDQDRKTAIYFLKCLINESDEFPASRIHKLINALTTDCWEPLSDDFVNQKFISRQGFVLIIGPFSRGCDHKKITKLTAIFGQIETLDLPIQNLNKLVLKEFGPLFQILSPVLPLESFAACGHIGQQEAFLSPDGWHFPNSFDGPALINLTAHHQRFQDWIHTRIKRIFESKTADLILQIVEDRACQLQEYCLHEAGHAAGLGLKRKQAMNLIPTIKHQGWEEYKTDIVGFYLAAQVLSPEQAGRLVAATFAIRFGIDAHRLGGPTDDADSYASFLMLDRLLYSGHLRTLENGQLELKETNFEGFYHATTPHRREAVYLVEQELRSLAKLENCLDFYCKQSCRTTTKAVFERLVTMCA